MHRKTVLFLAFLLLAVQPLFAETEMADVMRANGKIYVVIAVLATIFAGLIGYLVYLDRKLTKIEKSKK